MQTTSKNIFLATGISIIVMAIVAIIVYGVILSDLIVENIASQTMDNVIEAEGPFRMSILGWIVILICDIVAAWGLYIIFKPINKELSLLSAWFRMVYAALLGVAISCLLMVLMYMHSTLSLEGALFIQAFETVWSMGLIVFGIHLFVLGYLALQHSKIPKFIGILILIAGLGYEIIHGGLLLSDAFKAHKPMLEMIFMIPMIFGELGLAVWCLIQSRKTKITV